MLRLYETTTISLRVPGIYTAGNHTAVTVKPTAAISPLYGIFVKGKVR
jgi:hypothetical protein